MHKMLGVLLLLAVESASAQVVQNEAITLRPGFAARWQAPRAFRTASVADASIIEVVPQSDHRLLLTAKATGSTNVMVLDEQGDLVANLIVSVGGVLNKVVIHNKRDNLAGYTAYSCSPVCERIDDKMEGTDRVPLQNQYQYNSTSTTTTIQPPPR